MIDKEKNNARYRLSHCVNVLFSVDHGTFRWRREDKSRGLFTKIQGQTDIDSRFGQMVSKFMTGKFRPLISFTICTNQIHFPKKQLRKPGDGGWADSYHLTFLSEPFDLFVGPFENGFLLAVFWGYSSIGGVGIKMECPLELVSKVTSMKWNTNFKLEHLQKNVTFSFQKFCCSQKFF